MHNTIEKQLGFHNYCDITNGNYTVTMIVITMHMVENIKQDEKKAIKKKENMPHTSIYVRSY